MRPTVADLGSYILGTMAPGTMWSLNTSGSCAIAFQNAPQFRQLYLDELQGR